MELALQKQNWNTVDAVFFISRAKKVKPFFLPNLMLAVAFRPTRTMDTKTNKMNTTKDFVFQHEEVRKKLWCDAWVSTANANDCKSTDSATRWADAALEEFDARFPPPKIDNEVVSTK